MESVPLKLSLGGYSNWQIVMINAGVSNSFLLSPVGDTNLDGLEAWVPQV